MASIPFEDKVWIDDKRKLDGLCSDILQGVEKGLGVLIIAHFEATRVAVGNALRERGIQHHSSLPLERTALCDASRASDGSRVWLVLSSQIEAHTFIDRGRSNEPGLCILVAEHHPIASRDQALIEAFTGFPCKSQIIFHLAMTDALMVHFGGEKILGLLKALGHDDETCISHTMISSSIRKAQEKIEKKVRRETSAESAEEWFRFNTDER